MPCLDGIAETNSVEDSSFSAVNQEGSTIELHYDLCSPFCSCGCCASQPLNLVTLLSFEFDSHLKFPKKDFFLQISNGFRFLWQHMATSKINIDRVSLQRGFIFFTLSG